jgi:hypothetical protein
MSDILADGDYSTPIRVGPYITTNLSDGSGAIEVRAPYMQLESSYSKQALNTAGPTKSSLATYLVSEEGMKEVAAGVVEWDRVWRSLPASRSELMQQSRPCIGVVRTVLNGQLVDIQLFSVSISTWVTVNYTYSLGNAGLSLPADGPAGTVIHSSSGSLTLTQLLTFNGFDSNNGTFGQQFNQSWQRRRWAGDIWEQAVYVN